VSQLGESIPSKKTASEKIFSHRKIFLGHIEGSFCPGRELPPLPLPGSSAFAFFPSDMGGATRSQDRADWRRITALLVSVVVSIGFSIRCASVHGAASYECGEPLQTQAIFMALRFGALRCKMACRDFKSSAYAIPPPGQSRE
jgi:hypothetical protein